MVARRVVNQSLVISPHSLVNSQIRLDPNDTGVLSPPPRETRLCDDISGAPQLWDLNATTTCGALLILGDRVSSLPKSSEPISVNNFTYNETQISCEI